MVIHAAEVPTDQAIFYATTDERSRGGCRKACVCNPHTTGREACACAQKVSLRLLKAGADGATIRREDKRNAAHVEQGHWHERG